MGRYIVYGGKKLFGITDIHGSKNAALPVLCGCIINSGLNVIHNCPKITDVFNTCHILEKAGCKIKWDGSTVIVDSSQARFIVIDDELTGRMRSSIIFMGAFCSRFKKAVISKPGGCRIGKRPLDIHIEALEQMGVVITEGLNCFSCSASAMKPCEINLRFPSVGATENIMLASACAKGKTIIRNAACEPEIECLAEFLTSIGAKTVCENGKITVSGTDEFNDTEFKIIPDRIEAGTYIAACGCVGGEIFLKNANVAHMKKVIDVFGNIGCKISFCDGGIYVKSSGKDIIPQNVKTGVYPYFPTDMQPQLMSVLTLAQGTSIINESVFENRFNHALELNKMGADIEIEGSVATIKGVTKLEARELTAFDLRAGAGLIIAALACDGVSVVNGAEYIKRGYEAVDKSFSDLGVNVRYESR